MNYEQLIEELREEMLQLVNTKCDALLQMYRSGELRTDMKDIIRESSLITVSPAELKGKRPLEDDPWKFTGRNGCTDKGG